MLPLKEQVLYNLNRITLVSDKLLLSWDKLKLCVSRGVARLTFDARAHTHTKTHTHAHIHTHIHTHTHTHTLYICTYIATYTGMLVHT